MITSRAVRGLSQIPASTRQVHVTQDCFDAILKLGQPLVPHDFSVLYTQLRGRIDSLMAQPASFGLAQEDAQEVAYALVALADERALRASPELAQYWLPRRLQLHYFDDNMAGEGFFVRLETLRQQPGRHDALHAYYMALALGFEGRYGRPGGGAEIIALMASLRQTLMAQATLRPGALAAHGTPPEARSSPSFALRTPAGLITGLVAVALLLYAGMVMSLERASARVGRAADAVAPHVEP